MIYFFRTPRRMPMVIKWIACYMALSRIRTLSELRSVGLTSSIRELIDLGPPEGYLTRFKRIFESKIAQTHEASEKLLRDLGWKEWE